MIFLIDGFIGCQPLSYFMKIIFHGYKLNTKTLKVSSFLLPLHKQAKNIQSLMQSNNRAKTFHVGCEVQERTDTPKM